MSEYLTDFRAKYPMYNDMSDTEVADKLYSTYYSDMDRKAFDTKLFGGEYSPSTPEVQQDVDFWDQLKAGGAETANLMTNELNAYAYSGISKLGVKLGLLDEQNELAKFSEAEHQEYLRFNEQINKKFPRVAKELKDVESLGDFGRLAKQEFARGLPSLTAGIFGAIVGAPFGTAAATATGVVGAFAQTAPEAYANLRVDGIDAPGVSTMVGGVNSFLEVFPIFKAYKKMVGKEFGDEVADAVQHKIAGDFFSKFMKSKGVKVAGEITGTALLEGGTELTQEFVNQAASSFMNKNKELFSEDNFWDMLESGFAGFIVGGGVQTIGSGAVSAAKSLDKMSLPSPVLKKKQLENLPSYEELQKVMPDVPSQTLEQDRKLGLYNSSSLSGATSNFAYEGTAKLQLEDLDKNVLPEIVAKREEAGVLGKEEINSIPLTMTEATKLYPDGIPFDLRVQLTPQKTTLQYRKGPEAVSFVRDEVNKVKETALPRDKWEKILETSPFGKKQNDLVWKSSWNERFPKKVAKKLGYKTISKKEVQNWLDVFQDEIPFRMYKNQADKAINPLSGPRKKGKIYGVMNPHTGFGKVKKPTTKSKTLSLKGTTSISKPTIPVTRTELQQQKDIAWNNVFKEHSAPRNRYAVENMTDRDVVAANLGNFTASKKFKSISGAIIPTINRAANKATGRGLSNFVNNALEGKSNPNYEPIRTTLAAVMMRNILGLANNPTYLSDNKQDTMETLSFLMYSTDFFTTPQITAMERAAGVERTRLRDDENLHNSDLADMPLHEIIETKFLDFILERQKKVPLESIDMSSALKQNFERVYSFMEIAGEEIGKKGLKQFTDMYDSKHLEALDKAFREIRDSRTRALQELHEQGIASEAFQESYGILSSDEIRNPSTINLRDSWTPLFFVNKMFSTAQKIADKFPITSHFVRVYNEKENDHAKYHLDLLNRVQELLDNPMRLDRVGLFKNELRTRRIKAKGYYEYDTDNNIIGGHVSYPNESGKTIYIDDLQFIKDYKSLEDFFIHVQEELKRDLADSFLAHGYDPDISLDTLSKEINQLELNIQKEGHPQIQRMMIEEKRLLEQMRNAYSNLNLMIETEYVPRNREGDMAISVKRLIRDEEGNLTGEKESLGHYQFWSTKFLKHKDLKEEAKAKERIAKDFDLNDPDIEVSKPFSMNYNQLKKEFGSNVFTAEFVFSQLASQNSEGYTDIMLGLKDRVKAKGFLNYLVESKELKGWDEDQSRALTNYISGFSRYMTNQKYNPQIEELKAAYARLASQKGISPYLLDWLKKFMDYNNSPANDLAMLRMMNFSYALAGNISSAAVQLLNGAQAGTAYVSLYGGNKLSTLRDWKDSMGLVMGKLVKGDFKVDKSGAFTELAWYDVFDGDENSKVFDSPEQGKTILSLASDLYRAGYVNTSLIQESLGHSVSDSRGKVSRAFNDFFRRSGIPITAMEQASRISTAIMAMKPLVNQDGSINEEAVRKFKNLDIHNNSFFRSRRESMNLDNEVAKSAAWVIEQTHGRFDKSGRGEFQRGIMGSAVTPFMTHPATQLDFLIKLLKGKNTSAALFFLGTYFVMAGLSGLPGEELAEEVYDTTEQLLTDSRDSVENDFRMWLVGTAGLPKHLAEAITKGVPRAYLGVDLGIKTTFPFPGQGPMIGIMKLLGGAEPTAQQLLGTPALSYTQNVGKFAQTGDASKLIPSIAAQNLYESFVNWGTYGKGARTKNGTPLITPEDISSWDRILKATGFTPSKLSEAREEQYQRLLEERRTSVGTNKWTRRIADNIVRARTARENGDRKKSQEYYNQAMQDLQEYLKWKKQENPFADLKSEYNTIKTKILQGMNPQTTKGESKLLRWKYEQIHGALGYK